MDIGIVDTGLGTISSMQNMIKRAGFKSEIFADPGKVPNYTHLILPGVGHYSEGSSRLSEQGWVSPIRKHVDIGRNLLGVCLGMQLLGAGSEEGPGDGLKIFDFTVEKMKPAAGVRVPHMGWNTVNSVESDSDFEGKRFYFVHSYSVPPEHDYVIGITSHGSEFGSVVKRGKVTGAQFHPEKSHKFGMQFLSDFLSE
ncbi:imidazole glycerol phosphate synthase subunit HisH [Aurantimicrobium minutum]|uniref:imidazole glycerol phosphate synthase subunit HisH n=1 Tax=Aurantimicrobium minutum TaxID=708131 RepID=UPI0024730BED|nr:imidazole glycerol phosphate synthase subunit HisH [Aurantimicrobium minutum]MDH6256031.1 glutamine amidotransferase [Aurantimicrobium minutum]